MHNLKLYLNEINIFTIKRANDLLVDLNNNEKLVIKISIKSKVWCFK